MFHNHQWGRSRNQYHLLPVKDVECIYLACSVPPCLYYTPFLSAFALCSSSYSHPHLSPCPATPILPTSHGKIELISAIYIFSTFGNLGSERKKEKAGYIKTSCEHQSRSVEANTKEVNNILMSHDTSQLKKRTVCHKQTKHMMAIYRSGHLVPNTCPALYISLSLGSWALQRQISKAYHCLFAYVLCRLLLSSKRNIWLTKAI